MSCKPLLPVPATLTVPATSSFSHDATGCLTKPKWYETVVIDKNGKRGCAILLEETSIDRSLPKNQSHRREDRIRGKEIEVFNAR
jgi:hypothetical protein